MTVNTMLEHCLYSVWGIITLNLGDSGMPVPFQIDSGYECCMLPRHEYVRVTRDISLAMLLQLETVIVTYNRTHEKSLGQYKRSVIRRGVKHRLVFNIFAPCTKVCFYELWLDTLILVKLFVCLEIFSIIVMLVSMYLCNNLVITYFTVSVSWILQILWRNTDQLHTQCAPPPVKPAAPHAP